MGDAGLTGRKIIVDTYGGMARHGGGAFSRQGPDEGRPLGGLRGALRGQERRRGRAGRPLRGAALVRDRRRPAGLDHDRDVRHGNKVDEEIIEQLITEALRPAPGRDHPGARPAPPDLPRTAAYGHFGRNDIDAPWEETNRAAELADNAGLAKAGATGR